MRVLAIGIHPDDVELGCGGTVAKLGAHGHPVVVVDLARGESSSNGSVAERAKEAQAALAVLGGESRSNLGLPDGGIQSEHAEHTAAVVKALRAARPDFVLAPTDDDPHPDHESGARLIQRALYLAGIAGFRPDLGAAVKVRDVWRYGGRREVTPTLVVDITDYMDTKVKAALCHATQFIKGPESKPTPLNEDGFMDKVRARAEVAGAAIGARYGEAFSPVGAVAVRDIAAVIAGGGR